MIRLLQQICKAPSARQRLLNSLVYQHMKQTRGLPPSAGILRSSGSAFQTIVCREKTSKSWIPKEDDNQLKQIAKESMVHRLTQLHLGTAYELVDWFTENMPGAYFQQTRKEAQLEHMKAISALWNQPSNISLTLNNVLPNGKKEVTFVSSTVLDKAGATKGLLRQQLKLLPPADGTLSQVKIFSSLDQRLVLNTYTFTPGQVDSQGNFVLDQGEPITFSEIPELRNYLQELADGKYKDDPSHPVYDPAVHSMEAVEEFFGRVAASYPKALRFQPKYFCQQMALFREVAGTQNVAVDVMIRPEQEWAFSGCEQGRDRRWITLVVKNLLSKVALEQLTRALLLYEMDVQRVHLDHVDDGEHGTATIIRVMVDHAPDEDWACTDDDWNTLAESLKRMKWLDDDALDLGLEGEHPLGVLDGEITAALCHMLHGPLSKENPWAYSRENILRCARHRRHRRHAAAVAGLFRAKFDPENPLKDPEAYQARRAAARRAMEADLEDEAALTVFLRMLDAVDATHRTNLHMPHRYALSFRVDPRVLEGPDLGRRDTPFGAFFVHGRRFDGFHCRFRDIARGGIRLVSPATSEQLSIESARTYDEAWGLSSAQQAKNKDIPEGGSKGVVLVNTNGLQANARFFALRKSFKAFTDALLDLITDTPDTRKYVVDYFGRPELLYLGPDEQVIPDDINWVVRRARERGHPVPAAFMSSKPDAGINHKEFGVTSEGVFVFLDVALREAGLRPPRGEEGAAAAAAFPASSFTCKLTGGPDGDVAGNMLRILHREYGEGAKVVGVSDGSGCAEDPAGLAWGELLRLVRGGRPVAEFDRAQLGPKGQLHLCDDGDEGIKARNTMHNRVRADVFIPCGGRPNTIHKGNYRAFLLEDGVTPSSGLIVEAANLFVTQEARDLLHQTAGVKIIKDSSANKCGVITSSYEIAAAMLCSEEDFRRNKEAIVEDVMGRLRAAARQEAELLFREHRATGQDLPTLSKRISAAINRLTDAIAAQLEAEGMEKLRPERKAALLPVVMDHLPAKLVEIAGSAEEVERRLPLPYLRNAMASSLASRIVYGEGIAFVEDQREAELAGRALRYLGAAGAVRALADRVAAAPGLDPEARAEVVEILRKAGVKARLNMI